MASFEIFLMVCGVIGILTVLLNLFSSLGDHPKKRWASYVPSVDSDDFLVAIAEIVNAPLERGDEVAILNNGAEFLPAFLDALRSAKKTITFTAYMWRAGKMSDQVLAVLAERAAAGVEVRVLLDGLGGMFITPEELRPLTDAGGVVAWVRPPRFGKVTRPPPPHHPPDLPVCAPIHR